MCSLTNPSSESDSTPLSYTKGMLISNYYNTIIIVYESSEDALEIIVLLEETSLRKILLDLPEHLQDDITIKTMLQSVLLSLAPM